MTGNISYLVYAPLAEILISLRKATFGLICQSQVPPRASVKPVAYVIFLFRCSTASQRHRQTSGHRKQLFQPGAVPLGPPEPDVTDDGRHFSEPVRDGRRTRRRRCRWWWSRVHAEKFRFLPGTSSEHLRRFVKDFNELLIVFSIPFSFTSPAQLWDKEAGLYCELISLA